MTIGRRFILPALTLLPVLGLAAPAAWAAAPDYQALNKMVVESYVLPRYMAFADATADLATVLDAACADGRATAAEAAPAYHAALDAWMAVQHLRFGPSELFLRAERVEFWPDKRGIVTRHLAQMLTERKVEALAPQTFAAGSVAVQGFPALERLLFDSDAADWASPFACALTRAIGRNLKSIADGLLADWRDGDEAFAAVVIGAGAGNARYFDAKEASLDFAKALRGALLLVEDYKLGRPLGDKPQVARAERAEAWRSARSLRNVALNLKAAQTLYEGGGTLSFSALTRAQPQGAALDATIRAAFAHLIAAADSEPESLAAALKRPGGWERLNAIRDETRDLLNLMGGPLSQILNLPMGFNSYDGD